MTSLQMNNGAAMFDAEGVAAEPEWVPVLFVGADELYREGLKRVLTRAGLVAAGEVADLRRLDTDGATGAPPRLVLMIETGAAKLDVAAVMTTVRRRWPRARGLLLTREPAAVEARTLATAGLAGCVASSISSEALLLTIRLILLGESVFASPGAPSRSRGRSPVERSEGGVHLTPREWDIVRCLERGDANKTIAYKLGVSENTVKVILNNVMRKLQVSNRTQVALWARDTLSAE